ncbi:unnamed protein product, partial [marine sediment metagenome]
MTASDVLCFLMLAQKLYLFYSRNAAGITSE